MKQVERVLPFDTKIILSQKSDDIYENVRGLAHSDANLVCLNYERYHQYCVKILHRAELPIWWYQEEK